MNRREMLRALGCGSIVPAAIGAYVLARPETPAPIERVVDCETPLDAAFLNRIVDAVNKAQMSAVRRTSRPW